MKLPRLDILIYAHDGRGLGHASRSITIGMALRRLYPELRVLFVSGCKVSQELIGTVPLDWLKLPSYETEVVHGKSRGVAGNSLFSDSELGELRAAQLEQLVGLYRPRLVLCDHTPQGKHRELIPALRSTLLENTGWVLGVRGVIGAVTQAKSELARSLFKEHYQTLFWYGDSTVLGHEHLMQLEEQYVMQPIECGYVSRIREIQHFQGKNDRDLQRFAGTVAVPWLGEKSIIFLKALAQALHKIGPKHGVWRIFMDMGSVETVRSKVQDLFSPLSHCQLEPLSGSRYVQALLASRSAIIYGGYNSIVDILALKLPTVVVLREMQDNEQQIHLEKLQNSAGELFRIVEESQADVEQLRDYLTSNLQTNRCYDHQICLDGAENAAKRLWQLLSRQAAV